MPDGMNLREAMQKASPRMLVLITDPGRAKAAESVLRQAAIPISYRLFGRGTASSELMDYLGLDGDEKSIYLCALPGAATHTLMDSLAERLQLSRQGHGIAFSIPISGISLMMMRLSASDRETAQDMIKKGEAEMDRAVKASTYALLLIVANRGYSEDIMETARNAGATGGTVINARRVGMEEPLKFWGVSIHEEREIITVLVDKDKRSDIMRAIGEAHGIKSDAKGMVLSVPVDAAWGMI